MVVWLILVACGKSQEQERLRRVWEMQDHEVAFVDARAALRRGDVASARQAGVELSSPDPVPGIPVEVLPHLEAVRASGKALSEAEDARAAAKMLAQLTSYCAACHLALAVEVPGAMRDDPHDLLWIAVAFESEERWSAGIAALGPDPGALGGVEGWPERRNALASGLVP